MNMEMAHKNSMLAVALTMQSIGSECSLFRVGSTMVFAGAFCVIPEPLLL